MERTGQGLTDGQKQVLTYALSLVGVVTYQWGGRYSVLGDENTYKNRTGLAPYYDRAYHYDKGVRNPTKWYNEGMDCSGFVDTVYHYAIQSDKFNQQSVTGIQNQIKRFKSNGAAMTQDDIIPGDLALRVGGASGGSHVAIFLYSSATGNVYVQSGDSKSGICVRRFSSSTLYGYLTTTDWANRHI
jgi:cell wall-associated NlpC family hydrolase